MVSMFLAPSGGILNKFIEMLGGKAIPFLTEPKYFRTVLISAEIFKEIGWGTIIYLAAMTGIDPEIYEAAVIDGASRIQRILYITIPGIATTIVVLLVLRMGNILRNGFEQVFLLQSPLVYSVSDIFETYTYRVGLLEGRFSYSTAVGIFQSVVGLIMITLTNKLSNKISDSSLW
jgi:putative aldouronate transport system permease protein